MSPGTFAWGVELEEMTGDFLAMKSGVIWLRAAGAVVAVVALVTTGLLALSRSAQAGLTVNPMNYAYGNASAKAGPRLAVQHGRAVSFARLPNAAVTGTKQFSHPYLTRWGAARYSQMKKQASNTRTAQAPLMTNPTGLPLTVVGPNTPSVSITYAQGSTTETPSDMGIAVGDGYVVQMVNSSLAIYSINESTHAMTLKSGPTSFNTFFGASPGDLLGDPREFYDIGTGRFFLQVDDFTSGYYYLAVSQTSDPTGTWNLYSFNLSTLISGNFPDFDGLGFDSEAVYISGNLFTSTSSPTFTSSFIGVLCKAYLETGSTANCGGLGSTLQTYINLSDSDGLAFTVMPAYSYGTMRAEYFVDTDSNFSGNSNNKYTVWTLANPLELGGSETLTGKTIGNATFTLPPTATDTTGDTLDTGDMRVSAPPVVRNGQLYFAITSAYSNGSTTLADIQWFQFGVDLNDTSLSCPRCATIRTAFGFLNPTLGYSMDAWDPAMAVDTDGNIFFTFQMAGPKLNLTTVMYGRRSSTYAYSPGPDVGFFLGGGQANYTGVRTGDYTAVAIDPSSCTATGCYGVIGSGMIERTGAFGFFTNLAYSAYTINNP
jgi:hypothetical protein